MDLTLSPDEEAFRDELRTWLEENHPGEEPKGDEEEDFDRITQNAREVAKATADKLKGLGFQVHTEVRVGSPSSVLLEEGEEAGLVAVGANGLGSFRRAIVGSVSEAVVRHANAALVAR